MVDIVTNYVKLVPQRPTTMRTDRWWQEDRDVFDKKSNRVEKKHLFVFHITELDGAKVDTTYSVMSNKLQVQLAPLIESGALFRSRFTVTWNPRDYATEYGLSLI